MIAFHHEITEAKYPESPSFGIAVHAVECTDNDTGRVRKVIRVPAFLVSTGSQFWSKILPFSMTGGSNPQRRAAKERQGHSFRRRSTGNKVERGSSVKRADHVPRGEFGPTPDAHMFHIGIKRKRLSPRGRFDDRGRAEYGYPIDGSE